MQPIQDLVALNGIAVSLAANGKVRAVTLVPAGEPVAFTQKAGRVAFTVPKLTGHQVVEIAY